MGVYIKGMEMPESCFYCPMREWHIVHGEKITSCRTAVMLIKDEDDKPDWCPIIEIPPHGRLGDLDKLEQMFIDIDNAPYSGFDGEESFYSAEDAAQIIRLTPTVIPTEEGET